MLKPVCDFIEHEELFLGAETPEGFRGVMSVRFVGLTDAGEVLFRRGNRMQVGGRPWEFFKDRNDAQERWAPIRPGTTVAHKTESGMLVGIVLHVENGKVVIQVGSLLVPLPINRVMVVPQHNDDGDEHGEPIG